MPEPPQEEKTQSLGLSKASLEDLIRERVAHEILEVERELEKRIVARIRNELKKSSDRNRLDRDPGLSGD
jgi:hypothetical protein